MTLTQFLQSVKERCERATAGEWTMSGKDDEYDLKELSDNSGECISSNGKSILKSWDYEGYSSGLYVREADADFIAHSRTDIPTLLRIVERQREALEWYMERDNYVVSTSNEAHKHCNEVACVCLADVEKIVGER